MRTSTETLEYTATLLRLPQPLLDDIRHLARRERRSLNSELLCAVEEYLARRTTRDQPPPVAVPEAAVDTAYAV